MLFPPETDAPRVLGVVLDTFSGAGGFDELQRATFDAIASAVYATDSVTIAPVPIADARALDAASRRQAVSLMVVFEYIEHPLRESVSRLVEHAANELDVQIQLVHDARALANAHFRLLYMDLERQGWYRTQSVRESLHGRFRELLRSKLAYEGVVPSPRIARKWRGLRDCEPGTWGHAVAEFYEAHHFPYPGELHGIYELGARHDWVHVLADYGTDAEGECDVFAFIAASMQDERGLVLLAFTLGLFQNGAINRVDGRKVAIARADTLADHDAVPRFAEAFRRGNECTVDPMGDLDLFAYKDQSLDDLRTRWSVRPRTI
jgi:hypothetical protein